MPRWMLMLIGLAAAWLAAWVQHGPVGTAEVMAERLEAEARAVVQRTEVPGVEVAMARAPLGRVAVLSGPADRFQREGRGEFPGIDRRVKRIQGVAGVHWTDEGRAVYLPLLAEALIAVTLAYLAGLLAGRLVFGRRRRMSYLD